MRDWALTAARFSLVWMFAAGSVVLLGGEAQAGVTNTPTLGGATSTLNYQADFTGSIKVSAVCGDTATPMVVATGAATTASVTAGNAYTYSATCTAPKVVRGWTIASGGSFWWSGSNNVAYTAWSQAADATLLYEYPAGFGSDLLSTGSSTCPGAFTNYSSTWDQALGTLTVTFSYSGSSASSFVAKSFGGGVTYGTHTGGTSVSASIVGTDVWERPTKPVRLNAVGVSGCYVYIGSVEDSGTAGGGPSDYGDATDPDTSSSCSAFDVFCRIKSALSWAFVPDSATLDQYETLGDDLQTRIPFVYIAGTFDLLDFNLPDCTSDDVGCTTAYNGLVTLPSFDVVGSEGGDTGSIVVLGPGSTGLDWMRDARPALAIVIWLLMLVPLGLWIWRRLMPVAGSGGQ